MFENFRDEDIMPSLALQYHNLTNIFCLFISKFSDKKNLIPNKNKGSEPAR